MELLRAIGWFLAILVGVPVFIFALTYVVQLLMFIFDMLYTGAYWVVIGIMTVVMYLRLFIDNAASFTWQRVTGAKK